MPPLPVLPDPTPPPAAGPAAPVAATAPGGSDVSVAPAVAGEIDDGAYRTQRRFDRAARLFSEPGLHRLMGARVVVFGMGGVGSFAAEALVRSGVGTLSLVDFDLVCITNTNRQLHAMKGAIGKSKVDVLAERFQRISPTATIEPVRAFYNAESSEALLSGRVDFVVDAIDNMTAKAHLLATCVRRGIPVVASMGAAARWDPTRIRVADLSDTTIDPLARQLRKILRQSHDLACVKGRPSGVTAVYSVERPVAPVPPAYDAGVGFRCVCPSGKNDLHTCDSRRRIDGSAAFVTGAFGFAAASVVVRELMPAAVSVHPFATGAGAEDAVLGSAMEIV